MNNNQLFPKCTTENRPLKKKTSFYYLLVYVPPWPLHKQCPAFPLASPTARFATRASAGGACGSGLNSFRHQPASGLGTTAPQSFTSAATTSEHFFHSPALTIPSPLSLSTSSLHCLLASLAEISCFYQSHLIIVEMIIQYPISNIQYPIYNIQYTMCNIKQTSDEIKEK